MLTDVRIRALITRFADSSARRLEIPDRRTKSRLFLLLRKTTQGIASDWYVVYYRYGRRTLIKIGAYPALSLAAAREAFRHKSASALVPPRPGSPRQRIKERNANSPVPHFDPRNSISFGEAVILSVLGDLVKTLGIETRIDPAMIDLLIAAANLGFGQDVPVPGRTHIAEIPAVTGNGASVWKPGT